MVWTDHGRKEEYNNAAGTLEDAAHEMCGTEMSDEVGVVDTQNNETAGVRVTEKLRQINENVDTNYWRRR